MHNKTQKTNNCNKKLKHILIIINKTQKQLIIIKKHKTYTNNK